jgi:hypothetical protein
MVCVELAYYLNYLVDLLPYHSFPLFITEN